MPLVSVISGNLKSQNHFENKRVNYCSYCGSNAISLSIPQGDHLPRFVCEKCQRVHYTNPNMVVGCVIEHQNEIMLCRRGIEPRMGYWNLPCGFLENHETVQEGAIREVYEETGAKVILQGLHTVYNLPHANQVYLIFRACLQKSATWHLTPESTEIEFFKLDAIPWDEMAFSSNTHAIKHLMAQKSDNKTPKVAVGTYRKDAPA